MDSRVEDGEMGDGVGRVLQRLSSRERTGEQRRVRW